MRKIFLGLVITLVAGFFLVSCKSDSSDVIISKYVQNDIDFKSNQAIELYNTTKKTVKLDKYSIFIYSNGEDDIDYANYEISLSGEIKSGETYLIVHPDAVDELLDKADFTTDDLDFDGNDVIHLRKGKKVEDLIHDLGDNVDNFKDEIYVRKDNIVKGNTNLSKGGHKNSEWDFYVPFFYEVVGSHPVKHPDAPKFRENTNIINPDAPESQQYPETVKTGKVTNINDGDTAHFLPDYTGDARIRFLGINTPEMNHGGKPEPYAVEATENLERMLKWNDGRDADIYLQFEASGKNDTYGRTLAYVWSDGLFTNYEQVLAGLSMVSGAIKSNNFAYDDNGIYLFRWLNRAEDEARINKIGLWS